MGYVQRGRLDQPHVAVNPSARIPAGRVGWIIQPNRENIFSAWLNKRSQVDRPRSIAIGPTANKLPIQPNRRVSHGAIYFERNLFAGIACGNVKMLPVPADPPPGQLAGFARVFLLERPFNAPIMRQVEFAPARIVKGKLREAHIAAGVAFRRRWTRGIRPDFSRAIQKPRFKGLVIKLSGRF